MKFIYLDHNATTPLHPEIQEFLSESLSIFGNPSSIHWAGRRAKTLVREARQSLSEFLQVSPLELIFTSGASEANNAVIKSHFFHSSRKHFMCSAVEHPSVMKTLRYIESLGAHLDVIPVNRRGELDLNFYEAKLSDKTALVSVMLANNETGTIFPIQQMARMAKAKGAAFHTDAVQALGKLVFNLNDLGVDSASFSGHKFYSLKGSGLLYARKGSLQVPLIHGGAQERFRRGGTENLLGLASFGEVARLTLEKGGSHYLQHKISEIEKLRDHLQSRILMEIEGAKITAGESPRLANTLSLTLDGVDGETLLMNLDIKGYAVSTGAACSSGNPEPSPVLLAMGLERSEAQHSLRLSLGWENTLDEIDKFLEDLKMSVARIREISRSPDRFDKERGPR
jgi:cysteine desulfurase